MELKTEKDYEKLCPLNSLSNNKEKRAAQYAVWERNRDEWLKAQNQYKDTKEIIIAVSDELYSRLED